MNGGKLLLYGAGIAGLFAGGAYLFNLKRLSDEMEVETNAKIDKVSLSGIKLRIDFTLKNPTGGTVSVKQPFVKLSYKGNTLLSSSAEDGNFQIPKYGQLDSSRYDPNTEEGRKQPKPIFVSLGTLKLATQAPALLSQYRTSGQLALDITTISTINDRLPYKQTQSIALGKPKA